MSERGGHRVLRLDPETGESAAVAGTGKSGFAGDGGAADAALLSSPDNIDVDAEGNLFIADRGNERIRRVDAATGIITTVAGNGTRGPGPDGAALESALTGPFFVDVSTRAELVFTDTDSHRVRAIDLDGGALFTLAGNGGRGFAGDGGPAREASLARPHAALRLKNGDLLIADSFNARLRRVDHVTGHIETIAGKGEVGLAEDGTPALEAAFGFFGGVVEAPDGDLLFTEWIHGRVLRLELESGTLRVLAGSTEESATEGDAANPLATRFGALAGIALDARGRILIAAADQGRVRRIDLEEHTVETLLGE